MPTGKSFDDRQRSFEKRFVMDEEARFKAEARRNKLLGLWAAEKMGMSDAQAQDYAKAVIVADMEEPGEEDVFRKLRADFDAKSIECSDEEIRGEMSRLMEEAARQISEES